MQCFYFTHAGETTPTSQAMASALGADFHDLGYPGEVSYWDYLVDHVPAGDYAWVLSSNVTIWDVPCMLLRATQVFAIDRAVATYMPHVPPAAPAVLSKCPQFSVDGNWRIVEMNELGLVCCHSGSVLQQMGKSNVVQRINFDESELIAWRCAQAGFKQVRDFGVSGRFVTMAHEMTPLIQQYGLLSLRAKIAGLNAYGIPHVNGVTAYDQPLIDRLRMTKQTADFQSLMSMTAQEYDAAISSVLQQRRQNAG